MSNGRIPQEVIDAVLEHHDIADVVGKYVALTKQGNYLKGLCPFHSEKTPSFTVTQSKQIFHCFGCGAGGGIITFIMEIESCSFVEAVDQLANDADIPITWVGATQEQTAEQKERSRILDAHGLSAKYYHYILNNTVEGKPAMDYLRQRGFTQKLIDTFMIGYAPPSRDTLSRFLQGRSFEGDLLEKGGLIFRRNETDAYTDRFRGRIIFPITDAKGDVIAFSARSMGDEQPKYLNSPESVLFTKGHQLYNLHLARPAIRKQQQSVLFEGFADVIKAWDAEVMNGIATMGTALTDEHAAMIRRNADSVLICFDGDEAGRNAAYKSIPVLERVGCQVKIAMLPDGLDPDDYIQRYGAAQFREEIIKAAVPSTRFKLIFMKKNFRLNETDGRLRYIDTALKLIAELHLPTEREHYLRELGSEFDYTLESLKQQMNQIRESLQKKIEYGDNNSFPWNNDMNKSRGSERKKPLFPANYNAERKLLEVMMHDSEVAELVRQQIDDRFVEEAHAALAIYLYAYYAHGHVSHVGKFISTLQDEQLESLASSISMMDTFHGASPQVINDYINIIKGYKRQIELIEEKKEQLIRAERSGEAILAAKIGTEIITLERQLKSL